MGGQEAADEFFRRWESLVTLEREIQKLLGKKLRKRLLQR